MDTAWRRLADLAGTHHGTITVDGAAVAGIAPHVLHTWARAGRLVRCARGTYVVAGSPESWRQRVSVATGASGAWASHRTAAALWRFDGFPPRAVEVVSLRGRRRTSASWRARETRTLHGVDLAEVDGIPCTAPARTLLDLPSVAHPHLVTRALDHACRRDRDLLPVVAQRHLELPRRGRRGAGLMTALLDERLGVGQFATSPFEDLALRLVRTAGLPEPVLQHPVREGTFVAFLDMAWPDIAWSIECDSLAHHSGKGPHEWDRTRRRHLERLGWDTVEVTYDDVTKRRRATGRQLRQLYEPRRAAVGVLRSAELSAVASNVVAHR